MDLIHMADAERKRRREENVMIDAHDILQALRDDPSLDIPTALDDYEVTDEDQRAEIAEAIYEMTRHLDAYDRCEM